MKTLLTLIVLLSCSSAHAYQCLNVGGCSCGDAYIGTLTTTWPESATTSEHGELFDIYTTPTMTYFSFNTRDYAVPSDAIIYAYIDYQGCVFQIEYDGDPIFHDTGY